MESFNGIDLESAGRVAGNGFYYLMGDIARLHSAVITYARDFMIDRGFTYCIPPFMIRSNVVTGVMSFAEMDAMMYKIEGEDLYLIGTICLMKVSSRRLLQVTLHVSEKKKEHMELKKEVYTVSISLKNKK